MKYGMGFAPNSWSELKSYMLSEGYSEQELIDASLISRSLKNTKNTYDFFVNRAMFPFIDLRGNIVGFGGRALSPDDKRKYLNSKDTAVYNKNRFLFSMNFAKMRRSRIKGYFYAREIWTLYRLIRLALKTPSPPAELR